MEPQPAAGGTLAEEPGVRTRQPSDVARPAIRARRQRWCNRQVVAVGLGHSAMVGPTSGGVDTGKPLALWGPDVVVFRPRRTLKCAGVMPDIAAGFAATIEAARRYPGTRDLLLLATVRTGRRLPRRHPGLFRALACIDRRDHHVIPSQETAANEQKSVARPSPTKPARRRPEGTSNRIAIQPSASIPASSRRKPAIEIRKHAGSRLNINLHSQRLAAEQAQQHPRWTKVTPGLRADTQRAGG